jgi:hypothetical protein
MAVQTGRTDNHFCQFIMGDASNGALRSVPISGFSALGATYEVVDMTAFQDAVKGALLGMPDAPFSIHCPWDTTAAQTVGTLSGSHTILSAVVGLMVPLTIDFRFGIRHAWETGEPNWGETATATSGYIVSKYVLNDDFSCDADFVAFPGSSLVAFGTSDETT